MKRLAVILLALVIAIPVFAGPPAPKFAELTTFSNDETIYLAVRGRQTSTLYKTTYVTLQATQNVYVEFDPGAELAGYYTGTESAAWGGGSYTEAVGNQVFCPINTKVTLKVTAEYLIIKGVTTPGTMDVWVEYEE